MAGYVACPCSAANCLTEVALAQATLISAKLWSRQVCPKACNGWGLPARGQGQQTFGRPQTPQPCLITQPCLPPDKKQPGK